MIRNRVYSKGEIVYALISSTSNHDVLFPTRCVIHDVKHGDTITEYHVRIDQFFDDLDFLKRFLFGAKFKKGFGGGVTKWKLLRKNYKTKSDFDELMVRSGDSYKVVVDGPMICKTKIEMMDLFNKIHNFFIEHKIYELFELCGRSSYSDGVYYYKSKGVFKAHLLKFLGDRGYDGDKYLDDILFRATSRELDKID